MSYEFTDRDVIIDNKLNLLLQKSFQNILEDYLSNCIFIQIPVGIIQYKKNQRNGVSLKFLEQYKPLDIKKLSFYQKLLLQGLATNNTNLLFQLRRGRS